MRAFGAFSPWRAPGRAEWLQGKQKTTRENCSAVELWSETGASQGASVVVFDWGGSLLFLLVIAVCKIQRKCSRYLKPAALNPTTCFWGLMIKSRGVGAVLVNAGIQVDILCRYKPIMTTVQTVEVTFSPSRLSLTLESSPRRTRLTQSQGLGGLGGFPKFLATFLYFVLLCFVFFVFFLLDSKHQRCACTCWQCVWTREKVWADGSCHLAGWTFAPRQYGQYDEPHLSGEATLRLIGARLPSLL